MSVAVDQVLGLLKKVVHPGTNKDIIEMGLVENLKVSDSGIGFNLHFKKANDPLKSSIKKACERILSEQYDHGIELDINIVYPEPKVKKDNPVLPGVTNVIAIASGKGGVGKSTVATNLAVAFAKAGAKTGLIDADIFGPSIPKMLDAEGERPAVTKKDDKDLIIPVERYGLKTLSLGFFTNPDDATVWRGPMASNALKQMMGDADWGELDYLFVDLPPGTSDIHLTLVQTVPVTGAVIVSTPQDVALADAVKGISMFANETINVPVLGIIENMAWFTPEELPENKYYIFGKEGCKKLAESNNIPFLGQVPIVQSIREGGDEGKPAVLRTGLAGEYFKDIAEQLRTEVIRRNANLDPTQKVEITRRSFHQTKNLS